MDQTKTINIYTDGGSRGNPGPSALGVFIEDAETGAVLAEIGKTLGINTNNFAEYSAILEAWSWLVANKNNLPHLTRVNFYMDSNLAVSQLNGVYRIKNAILRELLFSIREKEGSLSLPVIYKHVPREQNKKADRLVNLALDNKINLT
jgi:ribonuclease HI